MTKLEKRKAALIERLDEVKDERTITALERTLDGSTHYSLTKEQQHQLDASLERYLHNTVKTYTPEQVRTRALKAVKAARA